MALVTPVKNTKNTSMEHLLEKHPPKIPKIGDVIEGVVLSVGKNELLIDIDGVLTGIVRGKELQDEMGEHESIKPGVPITVTVLDAENERGLIELSLKEAIHQRAWDTLRDLQKDGTKVVVPVVDANKGGLIVKLGGVIGFLPVSQLTTEHYPRVEGGDKNKILEKLKKFIGQKFDTKVITVNEGEQKLIVSEKAAWEEVQHEKISQYEVGTIVEGAVSGIVDFGCFVKFGDGLEGLVHISEMAWQRVDSPRDLVKVGDHVKAKIIEVDASKIFLSFKQLDQDPWAGVADLYHVGQIIRGTIAKINPYGLFVDLGNQLQGLCHISEISSQKVTNPRDIVKEGEEREFKILNIEADNRRIGLSMKALEDVSLSDGHEPATEPSTTDQQETDQKTEITDAEQTEPTNTAEPEMNDTETPAEE
ncbi:MAG: hypothetical protein A2986_02940 [Candidatus Jacksonbacteria bacterium RIFCSPLOWO2_01_FULL_44_13]|nr:MAG: hypothetical protein A2986_02940 [Candidatus Jacksonbacteria bacterium RIFCSPLOWO2_01_FULL_44_13]